MIKRIILENYMSHARTELEPSEGLTVICGPNNCGKSAVVSAIETLCFNSAGGFMVRHGAEQASVTIETDDGHTLVWRRKKNTVSYVIDGREVHRLGMGGVPDDLHKHLRLPRVENANKSFDVHLGMQKSPIFLIDREAEAAAFFSTSSDAERLLEMQRRHRSKVQDQRAIERRLTAQIEKLDAELQSLSPLTDLSPQIESIEREWEAVQQSDRAEQVCAKLVQNIAEQTRRASSFSERTGLLKTVSPPPDFEDEQSLANRVSGIESAQVRREMLDNRLRSLHELTTPPHLEDIRPIEMTIGGLVQVGEHFAKWSASSSVAVKLQPPPVLEDEIALGAMCKKLTTSMSVVNAQRARLDAVCVIAQPPEIADTQPLADFVKRMEAADRKRLALLMQLDQIAQARSAVKTQIESWVAENPTCPVCGAPTQADQLLAEAHTHA